MGIDRPRGHSGDSGDDEHEITPADGTHSGRRELAENPNQASASSDNEAKGARPDKPDEPNERTDGRPNSVKPEDDHTAGQGTIGDTGSQTMDHDRVRDTAATDSPSEQGQKGHPNDNVNPVGECGPEPSMHELIQLADQEEARYRELEASGELPEQDLTQGDDAEAHNEPPALERSPGTSAGEKTDEAPTADQVVATGEFPLSEQAELTWSSIPGELSTKDTSETEPQADRQAAKAREETEPADGEATEDATHGMVGSESERVPPYDLDKPLDAHGADTPRAILERFDPQRAGLPEISREDAAAYVRDNANERPWLKPAEDSPADVQRVIAAIDQGQGHALERHEGHADDEKLRRRVTELQDPAQLDDAKRAAGIDGCKPGDKPHRCGDIATAIQDPAAFATAFARAVEHPDVQRALTMPFDPDDRPDSVAIEVSEVFGPEGYRYCSGYTLEPVGGSVQAAQDCRAAWVEAKSQPGRESDVPQPQCKPVTDYEGATIELFFRANRSRTGYETATMYVQPWRPS